MKKFKNFFYPVYLVTIAMVFLVSFDIARTIDLVMKWGWVERFTRLPYIGRNLMVFLAVLMLIEFIVENIHLIGSRKNVSHMESDIIHLKAKLYDKSQEEVSKEGFAELEDEEEDDLENEDDEELRG